MFEIGASLREARTRQSLEFDEMEARTKVRAKYLRALEAEQFDVLPGHTYIKGFLRTYADSLGLDGQLYVDEYNSRFVVGDEDAPVHARRAPSIAARRRSASSNSRESHVVGIALAAIALVTALVIAAWRFGGPEEERVPGLTPAGARTTQAQAAAQRATVVIRALRGDSFMEVRAGTRAGRQLYKGTLLRGQVQRFPRQRAVFVSLGTPGNIVVKLNGNRLRLPACGEALVTARGVSKPAC